MERTVFETVFRGAELPPAERFDGWRQLAFASHAPTELRTDHADDFDATLRLLELGPVQVSVLACPSLLGDGSETLVGPTALLPGHVRPPVRACDYARGAIGRITLRGGPVASRMDFPPAAGRFPPALAGGRLARLSAPALPVGTRAVAP
ncbi:hypothetical protein [Streptomyces marispadix]|uniref:AraC family transcriptional regulator n=1 Tax=Streptomyces marispadix TaxID=2922868 RepID=A0ABS9SSQ4_9ACTN|nr:hypothetical protein [Streptomyces marispadix]MCH6159294.1 hypothetical protein [Streptomyces marispadix]